VCPDGFLPAYSVDTEHEAKQIIVMLPVAYDGLTYAAELFDRDGNFHTGPRRIDAMVRFGKRCESIHNKLKEFNNE
jgi:hypothetical protein